MRTSGSLGFVPKFITGWALTGALAVLLLAGGFRLADVPIYVVALSLAVGARGMAKSSASAWRLTLGIVAVIGLWSAAFLFTNAAFWAAGHASYLDSPATILVVLINCALTLLPVLIVAFLCWRARPLLRPLIAGRQVGAT